MKASEAKAMLREFGASKEYLEKHEDKFVDRTHDELWKQAEDFKPHVMFPVNDKDGSCGVIERFVGTRDAELYEAIGDATVNNLFFQVFHTDVNKLSSRSHLRAIDNDNRRPIYLAALVGKSETAMRYLMKNRDVFQASMNIHVDCRDGEEIIYRQTFGRTQQKLHAFVAWLSHMTGMAKPSWCTGWVSDFKQTGGVHGAMVGTHQMEIAEFEAVLRGEIDAKSFIPPQEEWDQATMKNNDGVVVTFDQAIQETVNKAKLEALDVACAVRN